MLRIKHLRQVFLLNGRCELAAKLLNYAVYHSSLMIRYLLAILSIAEFRR